MPLATYQQNDQLGEIVIDSPPHNLFSEDLLADLRAAVDQAADSDIRALLLRAEGDNFSAGADVSIFIGLDEARAAELETTVLSLIAAIEDLPVPALALIHGQCYAGALEVCLSCDLIWAAEGSQIGQIEAVAGSIPYAGGTQRIASRIGAGRAAEMVLTAAILPPDTLASWGLINRVLPADRLDGEGRAFAQSLASGPTRAHAVTKRVLHAWRSGGVAAADQVTQAEGPAVMLSQDTQEGIASLQRYGQGHANFNNR
ncbi:MAG: enoyl-CoA hydratase/isomerase family protein [Solirubrobacteraceae bacterium]